MRRSRCHLDERGRVEDAQFHVTNFAALKSFARGSLSPRCPRLRAEFAAFARSAISSLQQKREMHSWPSRFLQQPIFARVMNLAQILQSHALSFFHLSAPDLFLGFNEDIATRNIFRLIQQRPELARSGIRLRQIGQQIIEALGGKRIHSSWGDSRRSHRFAERDQARSRYSPISLRHSPSP